MTQAVYPRISNRVSKLGESIATINLPAKITCNPDAPCVKNGGCYACKGNFAYKSVANGIMKNYEAYEHDPQAYFNIIDSTLKMIPYKYFRYHSSGDIVDETYLDLMFKVARKHKGTRFLCFTKKYKMVNNYLTNHQKPANMVIVFSNWNDWICDNPHNLPTSWVRFGNGETIPAKANECSGFCGECANTESSCWHLKKGQSVVFNKH